MSASARPGARLGRGLAALLGDAVPNAGSTRSTIAVVHLEPGPFQPRTMHDAEALADLTASIAQQGVLQPILARPHPTEPGRFQIIAGERRWRAAQAAGLHEMPVLVRALGDTEAMAAALVENLQRQDLDAIEEAEGYNRLLEEFGLTQEQLGNLVGKSRTHITNTLRLRQLPPEVRAHVQSRALSPGHARALLMHKEPVAAARIVLARNLTVRQTEALSARPDAKPKPAPDLERQALEGDLSRSLGLQVKIDFDGKGGTVRLTYRSLDQLESLIARLQRPGPA